MVSDRRGKRRKRHRGARPYLVRQDDRVSAVRAALARMPVRWGSEELEELIGLVRIWQAFRASGW
jgi:hypothetical protein